MLCNKKTPISSLWSWNQPKTFFSPLFYLKCHIGATSSAPNSQPATSPLTLANAPCQQHTKRDFPKVIRHTLPTADCPGRSFFKLTHTARSLSVEAVRRSVLLHQTAFSPFTVTLSLKGYTATSSHLAHYILKRKQMPSIYHQTAAILTVLLSFC